MYIINWHGLGRSPGTQREGQYESVRSDAGAGVSGKEEEECRNEGEVDADDDIDAEDARDSMLSVCIFFGMLV